MPINKYTFRPRYQYDSSGTPTGLARLNEVFDSVPDWLERRSIIQQLHEQCVLNNRDDAEFYPIGYTDKDFGEWFFRQPEKQFRHIVLTDAAPKNALLSATAGGGQPENAVLLNTETHLTSSGSRYTDLTNAAINSIEWKCDNVQQPASDSTTRTDCQAYLSDKLLSDEDLGGVVLSKNKLWLEHVNQYSLPDWAKQQLETIPKSDLREDTVVIDGKPYPLSCLWKGCPK